MRCESERRARGRLRRLAAPAAAMLFVASGAAGGAGLVDGNAFVDICGDDAVRVEVSIPRSLIQAFAPIDPELHKLVGGLESIRATIFALDRCKTQGLDKVRETMRALDSRLKGRGWERLARVVDEDAEVYVLVLNDEQKIEGLAVLVLNLDDRELVFANIAGTLDLAAMRRIGESFGMPGFEHIPSGE